MTEDRLTPLQIQAFARHLRLEEKSEATMEKYLRDIRAFARWLDGREISKGLSAAWKAHLVERGYAPASINAKLSALNSLLEFLGLGGCRVKFLRVQRRLFRDAGRELTKAEYQRLLDTAHRLGQERLGLLVEAMGATGIRVSEVRYLTVEAARQGKAEISLKGKIRTILLPEKLCRKLLQYAQKQKTASGAIFRTKSGKEAGPPADLGGDEAVVRARRGGPAQGVPPQSAAPVCYGVLPDQPGHRQAGGPAGPQQHRDHPHLPGDLWRRTPADAGPAGTDLLITEFAFRHK